MKHSEPSVVLTTTRQTFTLTRLSSRGRCDAGLRRISPSSICQGHSASAQPQLLPGDTVMHPGVSGVDRLMLVGLCLNFIRGFRWSSWTPNLRLIMTTQVKSEFYSDFVWLRSRFCLLSVHVLYYHYQKRLGYLGFDYDIITHGCCWSVW